MARIVSQASKGLASANNNVTEKQGKNEKGHSRSQTSSESKRTINSLAEDGEHNNASQ